MQLYIKTPYMRKGKLKYKKVQNIGRRKGVLTFLIDQQYAFQCAPLGETEESMTVIRMTIPAGTPVELGYAEIRDSLRKLGYDPIAICEAMGFTEVINCIYADKDCTGVACDGRRCC